MKYYNKLVRDKIPKIIEETGKKCSIRYVDEKEQLKLLEGKLNEEVLEYIDDKNLEELADIMEVLFGLAKNLGFSEEELLKCREEKKKKRGGFEEGVLLLEVYEEQRIYTIIISYARCSDMQYKSLNLEIQTK